MQIIPGTAWGKFTNITRTLLKASNVNLVVVHHDGALPPETSALAYSRVRAHQTFHRSKWSGGLGYNFLISPFGQIFEGRGFDNRGAHAASVNHRSWGVCFLGSELTPESIAAFLWLHIEMQRRAKRPLPVIGHGMLRLENTACPGKSIRDWVSQGLRAPVAPAAPVVAKQDPPAVLENSMILLYRVVDPKSIDHNKVFMTNTSFDFLEHLSPGNLTAVKSHLENTIQAYGGKSAPQERNHTPEYHRMITRLVNERNK